MKYMYANGGIQSLLHGYVTWETRIERIFVGGLYLS